MVVGVCSLATSVVLARLVQDVGLTLVVTTVAHHRRHQHHPPRHRLDGVLLDGLARLLLLPQPAVGARLAKSVGTVRPLLCKTGAKTTERRVRPSSHL